MNPAAGIVVIGGGCSGTLVAAQLLRHSFHGTITVVEPRQELGEGLAYSTLFEEHLLNVPAGKISAFTDAPSHFLDWLRLHHDASATPATFAPRKHYGEYLKRVLQDEVERASEAQLVHRNAEAVDVETEGPLANVALSDGEFIQARKVVLALGNPASSPVVEVMHAGNTPRFNHSPWHDDGLRLRHRRERVLLLGSGLTAIDSMLALLAGSDEARVFLLSRRGLLPRTHAVCQIPVSSMPALPEPASLTLLVRHVRERIAFLRGEGHCWRGAIDELRPVSNRIWRSLLPHEQRRFLRHLKPYWEPHRHRMAPEIAARTARYLATGSLAVVAGRLRDIQPVDGMFEVRVDQPRGPGQSLRVDRIINCTGIHEDYTDSRRPLIRALIAKGLASANHLGLGFRTGKDGALIDARGATSLSLFTLGPPRRGELFETTALPEIRAQAESLARHLAATSISAGT